MDHSSTNPRDQRRPTLSYGRQPRRAQGWWWWLIPFTIVAAGVALYVAGVIVLLWR
jgi:hypothetical protein